MNMSLLVFHHFKRVTLHGHCPSRLLGLCEALGFLFPLHLTPDPWDGHSKAHCSSCLRLSAKKQILIDFTTKPLTLHFGEHKDVESDISSPLKISKGWRQAPGDRPRESGCAFSDPGEQTISQQKQLQSDANCIKLYL